MKKLTSLFLSAILIVSLVSCQSASITEFEQYLNDGDYSAALELYEANCWVKNHRKTPTKYWSL